MDPLFLNEAPLVFLDVETTGLAPNNGDRVVEIALLKTIGSTPADQVHHLVNPQRMIPQEVVRVHHITDAMVSNKPTFADVAMQVQTIVDGAILVGHNVLFDIAFISREFELAGKKFAWGSALDTLRLSRRTLNRGRNSLQLLVKALPLDISAQAHRAMGDVLATWRLFDYIISGLGEDVAIAQLEALQGGRILPGAELRQTFGRRPESIRPLDPPEHLQGMVALVQDAISRGLNIEIEYEAQGGTVSRRIITPLRLEQMSKNYVCLRAFCHARGDKRTFRLDRIKTLRVMG